MRGGQRQYNPTHEADLAERRAAPGDRVARQAGNDGHLKAPVTGPVMARTLNLDGDRQADLEVHGGVDKAIYAYPSEHYE